jgi:galactokinase
MFQQKHGHLPLAASPLATQHKHGHLPNAAGLSVSGQAAADNVRFGVTRGVTYGHLPHDAGLSSSGALEAEEARFSVTGQRLPRLDIYAMVEDIHKNARQGGGLGSSQGCIPD